MASKKRPPESPEESRLTDTKERRPNLIQRAKMIAPGKNGLRISWPCPMDINDFAYYILGYKLWSKQREMVELMWNELNVAIATGQKVGKTDGAAIVLIGHAYLVDDSRGIFIAPTQRQVQDVTWYAVKRLWRRSGICYDCRQSGVRIAPCPHSAVLPGEIHETAFSGLVTPWGNEMFGFSASEPDRAAGFSSPHLRWVIDEASGIGRAMFEAIQGNRMGGAPIGMITNPICTSGPLFDAFHKEKADWSLMTVSSEDSPNITGEGHFPGLADATTIKWFERVYGRDSLFFTSRVLGQFPTSIELQIFPWDRVQAGVDRWPSAQGQTEAHLQVGYDPASVKGTGDECAIAAVREYRCEGIEGKKGLGMLGHVGFVGNFIAQHRQGQEPVVLVIDASGSEGAKALGELQAWADLPENGWLQIIPVYTGAFPLEHTPEREHYHSVRDVLFAHCTEWLTNGGAIPMDDLLVEDMAIPCWHIDDRGQKRATSKDDFRKCYSGRRSPDRLDALCLAVYHGHELAGILEPRNVRPIPAPSERDRMRTMHANYSQGYRAMRDRQRGIR